MSSPQKLVGLAIVGGAAYYFYQQWAATEAEHRIINLRKMEMQDVFDRRYRQDRQDKETRREAGYEIMILDNKDDPARWDRTDVSTIQGLLDPRVANLPPFMRSAFFGRP